MAKSSSDDDLLTPSLGGGAPASRPEPYNLFAAIMPGVVGGPVAVTIGMVIIAYRLGVSRAGMVIMLLVGIVAELAPLITLARDVDVTVINQFRVAAFATYIVQFFFVSRRFRSWQLRGRDTARFIGPGIGFALIGAVFILFAGVEAGEY